MRHFSFFLIFIFLSNCSTMSAKNTFGFSEILLINLNETKKKDIVNKFGRPDEKEFLPPKKVGFKHALEYWGFKKGDHVRLHMTFTKEKLKSVAYDIFEEDKEKDLEILLGKIDGKFKVIKEPVRNPHSMPYKCYLVDETKGISVLVDGYKKVPSFISFWNPQMGEDTKWFNDSTPEFCIASSCSKVTDPKAWKHNHCEWLEKLVAKKQRPARKKKTKAKKSNKNDNL